MVKPETTHPLEPQVIEEAPIQKKKINIFLLITGIFLILSLILVLVIFIFFNNQKTPDQNVNIQNPNNNSSIQDNTSTKIEDNENSYTNRYYFITTEKNGINSLNQIDVTSGKLEALSIIKYPLNIYQRIGTKWLVIDSYEPKKQQTLIYSILDKSNNTIKRLTIPEIKNLDIQVNYASISPDGTKAILVLSSGKNPVIAKNTEFAQFDVKNVHLYLYDFEKNSAKELTSYKSLSEWSLLINYTWSVDSRFAYVICDKWYCNNNNIKLTGLITIDTKLNKITADQSKNRMSGIFNGEVYLVSYPENPNSVNADDTTYSLSIFENNTETPLRQHERFADSQTPGLISPNLKYAIFSSRNSHSTNDLETEDINIVDLQKKESSVLIEEGANLVTRDYLWISNEELIFTQIHNIEQEDNTSEFTSIGLFKINIITKEIEQLLVSDKL